MVGRNNYPVEPAIIPLRCTTNIDSYEVRDVDGRTGRDWVGARVCAWVPPQREGIKYPPRANRQAKCWYLSDWESINEDQTWVPECYRTVRPGGWHVRNYYSNDPYAPPALWRDVGKRGPDEHQKRAAKQRFESRCLGVPFAVRPPGIWELSAVAETVHLDGRAPYTTWDRVKREHWHGSYQGLDVDDDDGADVPQHRVRRRDRDHDGKRAPDSARVTMRPGSWHISDQEWSVAGLFCEECGARLQGARRKYCSDDCQRDGDNRTDRMRRLKAARNGGRKPRKFPRDERGWYMQPVFPGWVPEAGIWKFSCWRYEHEGSPPGYGDPTGEAAVRWPRLFNPSRGVWAIAA
jgi:hypothetical protein